MRRWGVFLVSQAPKRVYQKSNVFLLVEYVSEIINTPLKRPTSAFVSVINQSDE